MVASLGKWTYTQGLHELGGGCYAYLQPDGSWGWSNAGLVVDGDRSLLVDTLFDLALTREMLDSMKAAAPAVASGVDTVVNTHSNGDHCFGNELVADSEIVASAAAAEEMANESPAVLAGLLGQAPQLGELGRFLQRCFGAFHFEGIRQTLPTRTFEGRLELAVGDKRVELIQVGPAHTRGDVLVHVPADRTIFTGDILFNQGHPILWAGPAANWIEACRRIAAMDVETVVPGHGPVTDRTGAVAMQGYLEYVSAEARKRYDAGMDAFEAARDIALDDYSSWGDAERIVVNVASLYREFSGDDSPLDIAGLFGQMARIAR